MPPKNDKLDLNPKQWSIVCALLQKSLPHYEAWAFGSRVNGRARKYSDLDLAVSHTEPMPFNKLCELNRAFEESDLDICVDIIDWTQTSAEFQRSVEQSGWVRIQ